LLMRKSRQLNIRLDDDVLAALEDIRVMSRPIPSRSEVIRRAILAERDRVRKLVEREAAR
jgi:metal-responsive CopG/Arc/MetJ family transcriptional regulator